MEKKDSQSTRLQIKKALENTVMWWRTKGGGQSRVVHKDINNLSLYWEKGLLQNFELNTKNQRKKIIKKNQN